MPFCCLGLDTSGGDAGYDETFDVTGQFTSGGTVSAAFEAYTIKDQLIVSANGSEVYNSGCVSGPVSPSITIPAGTTSIRVQIVPHCEGGTGTAWTLSISCA